MFTYYFIRHDLKTAERYLREASGIQEDFLSAEAPIDETWVKALRQRDDPIEKELKPLWSRIIKKGKK
jgi:CRISPR/Cas system-associated protein Cas10 (large subunit of type III CRISPR-Cas system)